MTDQVVDLSQVLLDDIGEVMERSSAPEGFYDVKIVRAEFKSSKKGNPMIAASYQIIGGGDYSLINDWSMLPTSAMEDDERKRRTLDLKRWCIAFQIPADASGIAVHMAEGREASAPCKITVEQDESGVNRNRIRYPHFSAAAALTALPMQIQLPLSRWIKRKSKNTATL